MNHCFYKQIWICLNFGLFAYVAYADCDCVTNKFGRTDSEQEAYEKIVNITDLYGFRFGDYSVNQCYDQSKQGLCQYGGRHVTRIWSLLDHFSLHSNRKMSHDGAVRFVLSAVTDLESKYGIVFKNWRSDNGAHESYWFRNANNDIVFDCRSRAKIGRRLLGCHKGAGHDSGETDLTEDAGYQISVSARNYRVLSSESEEADVLKEMFGTWDLVLLNARIGRELCRSDLMEGYRRALSAAQKELMSLPVTDEKNPDELQFKKGTLKAKIESITWLTEHLDLPIGFNIHRDKTGMTILDIPYGEGIDQLKTDL